MILKNIGKGFFGLALFWGLCACDNEQSAPNKQEKVKQENKHIPIKRELQFQEDSAYAFIEKQISFGPRTPASIGRDECAKWLIQKLTSYTPNINIQDFKARAFDKEVYSGKNIIASFNPENKKRIMLSAHYDTRPFSDQDPNEKVHRKALDGANDGGSGVAVLLELARLFKDTPPNIGVDIFLWDLEDFGAPDWAGPTPDDGGWALGSKYWAENPHILNYQANYGILLDMVGGKNDVFPVEGYSQEYAPQQTEHIWNIAAKEGYSDIFRPFTGMTVTDDHLPINTIAGIPTVDILGSGISTGYYRFNQHWHTQGDNIDNISKSLLNICGKVVERVVYEE